MWTFLIWVYIINDVLIATHHIRSDYWAEWDWFRLPGRRAFFMAVDYALLAFLMFGLVPLARRAAGGLVCALAASLAGLVVVGLYGFFVRRGRTELKKPFALFSVAATLVLSVVQGGAAVYLLLTHG